MAVDLTSEAVEMIELDLLAIKRLNDNDWEDHDLVEDALFWLGAIKSNL